jgi:hypothetical protein
MTLTPIEQCDDLDCPTIEIELTRPGTDQSDIYRSEVRHDAMHISGSACEDCGAELLATRRWLVRGDGLEIHARFTECSNAACGWRRML